MTDIKPRHPLIIISGWSGSGKTSLLEQAVPLLIDRGLKINVVKSSHHDVELEPPHKDSARLRRAGAAEVLLSSPYRFAIVHELHGKKEPSLTELLSRMQEADLTLVEGFRDEQAPKLEIYRPALGKTPMYPDNLTIEAVASDAPRPDNIRQGIVWLDLNNIPQIVDWLLNP